VTPRYLRDPPPSRPAPAPLSPQLMVITPRAVQPVDDKDYQYQVEQLVRPPFSSPDMVCVQTAGAHNPQTPAHRGMAVLRARAAPTPPPALDLPPGPTPALRFPRPEPMTSPSPLEPDFTGGNTGQVSAFGLREQRTQSSAAARCST